jgi:hypothetical protein
MTLEMMTLPHKFVSIGASLGMSQGRSVRYSVCYELDWAIKVKFPAGEKGFFH